MDLRSKVAVFSVSMITVSLWNFLFSGSVAVCFYLNRRKLWPHYATNLQYMTYNMCLLGFSMSCVSLLSLLASSDGPNQTICRFFYGVLGSQLVHHSLQSAYVFVQRFWVIWGNGKACRPNISLSYTKKQRRNILMFNIGTFCISGILCGPYLMVAPYDNTVIFDYCSIRSYDDSEMIFTVHSMLILLPHLGSMCLYGMLLRNKLRRIHVSVSYNYEQGVISSVDKSLLVSARSLKGDCLNVAFTKLAVSRNHNGGEAVDFDSSCIGSGLLLSTHERTAMAGNEGIPSASKCSQNVEKRNITGYISRSPLDLARISGCSSGTCTIGLSQCGMDIDRKYKNISSVVASGTYDKNSDDKITAQLAQGTNDIGQRNVKIANVTVDETDIDHSFDKITNDTMNIFVVGQPSGKVSRLTLDETYMNHPKDNMADVRKVKSTPLESMIEVTQDETDIKHIFDKSTRVTSSTNESDIHHVNDNKTQVTQNEVPFGYYSGNKTLASDETNTGQRISQRHVDAQSGVSNLVNKRINDAIWDIGVMLVFDIFLPILYAVGSIICQINPTSATILLRNLAFVMVYLQVSFKTALVVFRYPVLKEAMYKMILRFFHIRH